MTQQNPNQVVDIHISSYCSRSLPVSLITGNGKPESSHSLQWKLPSLLAYLQSKPRVHEKNFRTPPELLKLQTTQDDYMEFLTLSRNQALKMNKKTALHLNCSKGILNVP